MSIKSRLSRLEQDRGFSKKELVVVTVVKNAGDGESVAMSDSEIEEATIKALAGRDRSQCMVLKLAIPDPDPVPDDVIYKA